MDSIEECTEQLLVAARGAAYIIGILAEREGVDPGEEDFLQSLSELLWERIHACERIQADE